MPVNKVTIAVAAELLRGIDREAKARGMSRSEWVSYATTATLKRDLLLRSFDRALEEAGGPISAAEEAEAERKLARLLKTNKGRKAVANTRERVRRGTMKRGRDVA